MVLGMPSREQADLLRLGEAGEVVDLCEAGCRRLFEQAMQPGEDAFARNLITRAGGRSDRHRLKPLNAADQLAPVGEGLDDALSGPARARDELEAIIPGNRGHMLVGRDLAEAEDGDLDRPQRRTPAT